MKLSFSTLACPDWSMRQIIAIARRSGFDGIELRFVEGEDSLWKLPVFQGQELALTRQSLNQGGLSIACLDTSCRFHSPDPAERQRWLAEGERMTDLAAALGAPGIRVFGDTIQAGANRESTRSWIADSIAKLSESADSKAVEVWLETHGDFASARETLSILRSVPRAGVIWDPANCFVEAKERPQEGAVALNHRIRHVHIKDLLHGKPVLTGEGDFPLGQLRDALNDLSYDRFLSFEWEKKWHPEIPSADTALPHFVTWFREHWRHD